MLNCRSQLAVVQVCNAHVVMILGRSKDRLSLVMDLLFACVNQDLRALLDLGFLRVIRDKGLKTPDGLIERFRMHQLDSSFVRMNSARELL